MRFGFLHIGDFRRIACDAACYDHRVAAHELHGFGGRAEADVGGDGVRRMLLLHVGPHLHAVGADHLAIAQQLGGGGLDHPFVGHVGERVSFRAYEVEVGGVRHGHRFDVGAGQDLNACGRLAFSSYGVADNRHRRDDLGSDRAAQVWRVVHVFDDDAVYAAIAIDSSFADRLSDYFAYGQRVHWRARQRGDVDHPYDRFRIGEHAVPHFFL